MNNLEQYKEPEFDTYKEVNYISKSQVLKLVAKGVFEENPKLIDLAISQIQTGKRLVCKIHGLEYSKDSYLRVMDLGARKYGKNNWLDKGTNASILHRYKSAMGHIGRGFYGEEVFDIESGELHLDHGLCCLQMIKTMLMRGIKW